MINGSHAVGGDENYYHDPLPLVLAAAAASSDSEPDIL